MTEQIAVLVDLTRCTGCRSCQVACKQWNKNPASETSFAGTYENPPELQWNTFTRVIFREVEENGELKFLFRKDQCRHCVDPPCTIADKTPMKKYENGMVIADQTMKLTKEEFEEVRDCCPYDVPRHDPVTETLKKCNFCKDRQEMGKKPACVTACPTGALFFGPREEVIKEGQRRMAEMQEKYSDAELYVADEVGWIYLLPFPYTEERYGFFFDLSKPRQGVALG